MAIESDESSKFPSAQNCLKTVRSENFKHLDTHYNRAFSRRFFEFSSQSLFQSNLWLFLVDFESRTDLISRGVEHTRVRRRYFTTHDSRVEKYCRSLRMNKVMNNNYRRLYLSILGRSCCNSVNFIQLNATKNSFY